MRLALSAIMSCMQVEDPSGGSWTVRRQHLRLPRWRGFRRPRLDERDVTSLTSEGGGLGELIGGLLIVATIALSIAFVWPLILLLLELVAAVVLIGVRFLLGRWTVVAETVGERYSWHVRGGAGAAS